MRVGGRPYGAAAPGALAHASFRLIGLAAVYLALLQLRLLRLLLLQTCTVLGQLSCHLNDAAGCRSHPLCQHWWKSGPPSIAPAQPFLDDSTTRAQSRMTREVCRPCKCRRPRHEAAQLPACTMQASEGRRAYPLHRRLAALSAGPRQCCCSWEWSRPRCSPGDGLPHLLQAHARW